jgi:hypothetical protein
MSEAAVYHMPGFSWGPRQARNKACIDLVFIFWVMNHRRIVLCDGSQGFVSIDVALADELPILWVNPTKISHLCCVKACVKMSGRHSEGWRTSMRLCGFQFGYFPEIPWIRSIYLRHARVELRGAMVARFRLRNKTVAMKPCT